MNDFRQCWNCAQWIENEKYWLCYDCKEMATLDGSSESWQISRFLGMAMNGEVKDEEWQTIIDSSVGPKMLEELISRMDRKCLANLISKPRVAEAIIESQQIGR